MTQAELMAENLRLKKEIAGLKTLLSDSIRKPSIHQALDTVERYILRFVGEKQEHFHVVLLDTRKRIIDETLVSKGLLNESPIHPREVFCSGIRTESSGRTIRTQSSKGIRNAFVQG